MLLELTPISDQAWSTRLGVFGPKEFRSAPPELLTLSGPFLIFSLFLILYLFYFKINFFNKIIKSRIHKKLELGFFIKFNLINLI